MGVKKQMGLIESSNISFGHMIKLENYEEQLEAIVTDFLERKDILLSNLPDGGVLSILIKVYSEDVSLIKINEIILMIYQYLDEEQQVESTNSFEENQELKDYFSLTLIER